MIKKCSPECKINLDEVKEFELSTDTTNLPNSSELKCYFLCAYIEFGLMEPNSPKLIPDRVFDVVNQMEKDEQRKYLVMGKGCATKIKKN